MLGKLEYKFLLTIILLCCFISINTLTANAAFTDNYKNLTTHYINGSADGELINHQVHLILWNTTGVNDAETLYLGSIIENNFNDVFITNSTNTNLSFWQESNNGTCASYWVKIPVIPAGTESQISINIYTGSPSAQSYSNAANVFGFFDDFNTLDTTTTWTKKNAMCATVSNSVLFLNASSSTGATFDGLQSKNNLTDYNKSVIAKIRADTLSGTDSSARVLHDALYTSAIRLYSGTTNIRMYEANWLWGGALSTTSTGVWHILDTNYNGTYETNRIDFGSKNYWDRSTAHIPGDYKIMLQAGIAAAGTANMSVDWIAIRNSTTNEPTGYNWTTTANPGYVPPAAIPPTASFTSNYNVIIPGSTVTFTDTSSDNPTSWQWAWGDGTSNGTTQNPTHSFASAGCYTVTMTAINAYGSSTISKTNFVRVLPSPYLPSDHGLGAFEGVQEHWINGSDDCLLNQYTMIYNVYNLNGTSNGNTIYLNGKMRNNWSDIRFTTDHTAYSGRNVAGAGEIWWQPLNYSIEASNTTWAQIAVNVTHIQQGSLNRTPFLIWYGNYTITDNSEHDKTYPLNSTTHAPTDNTYSIENKIIVAYGDSITEGRGSTYFPYTYWVALNYPDYAILNSGMAGDTALNMGTDNRWNNDVNAYQPEIVMLMAATNDIVVQSKNAAQVESYLQTIINKIKNIGATPLIMTITPRNDYTVGVPPLSVIPEVNTWIRQTVTADTTLLFTDAYEIMENPSIPGRVPTTWMADNVHPNYLGYKIMGTNISLERLLPPVPNFTANSFSGIKPLTVDFTDSSTGTVTSWLWDFGDGTTSTEQKTSHTYNDVGEYSVSLTVTNDGGSNTTLKSNYIAVNSPAEVNAIREGMGEAAWGAITVIGLVFLACVVLLVSIILITLRRIQSGEPVDYFAIVAVVIPIIVILVMIPIGMYIAYLIYSVLPPM